MERALKSLTTADGRYAEIVLHGPDGWRLARLVLDAWSVALFSSRGPAFAAVERLKAGGLTTVQAIDRIAGDDTTGIPDPASPGGDAAVLVSAAQGGASAHESQQTERKGETRMSARMTETGRGRFGGSRRGRRLAWPGEPEDVTAADIDFEALAHVLANTCRWGGRTVRYHSLAAHAAIVSEEVEALDGLGREDRRRLALYALIADAPSAWLRGEPASSPRGAKLAAGIERAVREAAGLDPAMGEHHAELLRFVSRMTAAAERRGPRRRGGRRHRLSAAPAAPHGDRPGPGGAALARTLPDARRTAGRRRCSRQ